MSHTHEECAPLPASLISSLRAIGYDLSMAIADLIDNSVYADAHTISVDYDWNDGQPWIRILDDGIGMTESRLRDAMRLGSQNPLDTRHEADLGRFGLGLKTAAFSQGKLLTVFTKTESAKTATRSWDLDYIRDSGWQLSKEAPRGSRPLLSVLDSQQRGTVVLCQELDRLVRSSSDHDENTKKAFLEAFGHVARYLEMVFHRFLVGRDRVAISVGRHKCQPWDPFLTSNEFTQHMSIEHLDDHRIEVKPFVLPHVSKRSPEETATGAGLYGWNAHQGFYIYRNKRMIISGGYLDLPFTADEHCKLCRILVDLPNHLDHEWAIDVRKAAASPPSHVRGDLERIARATRAQAGEIYRARAGGARPYHERLSSQDVWIKKRRGEKIVYQINRHNEAIKRILAEIDPSPSWVKTLFHLVEKTVPHRLIILDNAEHEDCHVDLPADFEPPPKELISLCCEIFRDRLKTSKDPHLAADYACSFFDEHPAYRAEVDKLIEEMP